MATFFDILFRPKQAIAAIKDATGKTVEEAVAHNRRASAKLETTIRELLDENNALRAGAKINDKRNKP
jgi:hypothetical protein